MNNLYFLIEGGKALELVKGHIEERIRVKKGVSALAKELGVDFIWTDKYTGNLLCVRFTGERHPDFTVPQRDGSSRPKKGTEWARKFAECPKYISASDLIEEEMGIPTSLHYSSKSGEWNGSRHIGHPFSPCKFLFPHQDGPYVMVIPDVAAAVAEVRADGRIVDEPAASFVAEFDGCRRIEEEEWDVILAQHKLAEKKKATA
ncbi:hypothetical protein ACFFU8_17970 [Chromobacterium piscinae]|uniref:hypothetical protein n=1 Tax=Chromobacterium piscinae TaxID=686831 RepID=UPI001E55F8D7|nr:hypothetical protein [Chromobacterium piscinae]MCD5326797.1 hypothetical protein [Chromobacterium piscinae]